MAPATRGARRSLVGPFVFVLRPGVLHLLAFLFGSPHAIFTARVLAALAWLCPCHGDAECEAAHRRVARAVAVVASEARHPDHAAAMLLGACAHEGACKIERQDGGPAVTFWHLEVPRAQRAALLADDVAAARLALSRAGGTWRAYACGHERCDAEHEASAAGLRACERSARMALAMQ